MKKIIKNSIFFLLSTLVAFGVYIAFTTLKYAVENEGEGGVEMEIEMGERDGDGGREEGETESTDGDGGRDREEEIEEEVLTEVQAIKISNFEQDTSSPLKISGEVRSKDTVRMGAIALGNVKDIFVKKGQRVKKGDILVDVSGKENTQDIFIQKQNLTSQITRDQSRIASLIESLRDTTQIAIANIDQQIRDIESQIQQTRLIHQSNLGALQSDITAIGQTLQAYERNFALGNNNASVSENELRNTLQGTLLRTIDSLWAVSKSAIEPLGRIIDDVGTEDIENASEDLSKQLRDFVQNNTLFNETSLSEGRRIIDISLRLMQDALSEHNNIFNEYDPAQSSQANSFAASIANVFPTIQSNSTQIQNLELQLGNFTNTTTINLSPTELQIIDLTQRKNSLLLNIEITRLQQNLAILQLMTQIHTLENNKKPQELTLKQLQDNTHPDILSAQNQLENLKNNLTTTEANIQKLTIKAPFDGIIQGIFVSQGQDVSVGQEIIEIISLDIEILAFVNSSDIDLIRTGDQALINLFGNEEKFVSQVVSIAPTADRINRRVDVTLEVQKPFVAVPNSLLDVEFQLGEKTTQGIFIPLSSIIFEGNTPFIFILEGDIARSVEVGLGKTVGNTIEITSTLGEESLVIFEGNKFLKDGQRVSVQ